MKKLFGIILIIIGFVLAIILLVGPTIETDFMFNYNKIPLIVATLVFSIVGLKIYDKNN